MNNTDYLETLQKYRNRRARNRRITAYVFGTICVVLFAASCTAAVWIPFHFIAKFW